MFRRKKEKNGDLSIVGHPVYPEPTSRQRQKRSVMRCARLVQSIEAGAPQSFSDELRRRKEDLQAKGIRVPSDYRSIIKLAGTL